MSQVVPIVSDSASDSGNTKTESQLNKKKQIAAAKNWCFTLNNYQKGDIAKIIQICSANSVKYVIGEEVGEKGTPHLQGYIEFTSRKRPMSLFNFSNKFHWESAKGSRSQNIKYCTKDGKYHSSFYIEKDIEVLDELQFHPWQKFLFEELKQEPDDRKVHWFWEKTGKAGKSKFAKMMAHKYHSIVVCGAAKDMFNGIFNYKEEHGHYPRCVFVDISRDGPSCNYGALECIKNGLVFNAKYVSQQMIFNAPHVIVFSNDPPNLKKMSADRWFVKEIGKNLDVWIPDDFAEDITHLYR